MNKQTYDYKPCTVLLTDKDKDAWVYGVLIRKTKKRFYVYTALRDKAEYYKHIKFDDLNAYPYWEETIKKAKEGK